MEPSIEAAKAGVTTGEWGATLRAAFGEYRAPTGVSSRARQEAGDLDPVRAEVERVSLKLGRRLKFLVGKPGLDGHSNGAEQIAVRATDAGMEVVYDGIRLTPAEIVERAEGGRPLRRPVDPVGLASGDGARGAGGLRERRPRRTFRWSSAASSRPADAEALRARGRRGGLHAEGFRDQRLIGEIVMLVDARTPLIRAVA